MSNKVTATVAHHEDALKLIKAIHVGVDTFFSSNGLVNIDADLSAFLEENLYTMMVPKGPRGVCYLVKFTDIGDLDNRDNYILYPTAIIDNGSDLFAFWAFQSPIPADDPALVRLMKYFQMSLDQMIPLPGQGEWKLDGFRPDCLYRPNNIVEAYLPENRRFARRRRSKKGRF